MTFNELTTILLSKDNCALLIGLGFFVDNLHSFVRVTSKIVRGLDFNKERERAELNKKQLQYIVDNWHRARVMPVGSKKPK